jgi:magnesium-transporting ATPase (P-type)
LNKHFCFLACMADGLIGYNIDPEQKKSLCEMIQLNFPDAPIVMAVGDGLNDALMIE